MTLIGYARVSTEDQNLNLQLDALSKAGCIKIFEEKVSGRNIERTALKSMLEYIRPEDTIIVWKLDRLGRSLKNLIEIVNLLKEKNIGFKSLQENIDTTTSIGTFFFHMMAALAQFEKDLIRERTLAGLSAARDRGKIGGRPKKLTDQDIIMIKALYSNKDLPLKDILNRFNITKTTLYRILK